MRLIGYGETIVCKEASTTSGSFTMTELNKAEVISVGNDVQDLKSGDMIYYEPNKKEIVGEFFIIHKASVLCKVIE